METRLKRKKSAEKVGSIDDLLTEILIRLPANSFVQFKLVSKHWHSLITNPQLVRRWRYHANPAVGMFLPSITTGFSFSYRYPYSWYRYEPEPVPVPEQEYVPFFAESSRKPKRNLCHRYIRVLNSCNGLLLCEINRKDYVVYNPFTNEYSSALPKLDGNIVGMNLAFDPAKSSDRYKVVCVRRHLEVKGIMDDEGDEYQIDIYSSETPGAWRSSVLEPFVAHVIFPNGVYWNNAIHWIDLWGRESLYFNIHREVLEEMPNLPMLPAGYVRRNFYFGESCDHLHYIQIFGEEIQFDVYEMKRDYSEWFVKYHVDLSLVLPANLRARYTASYILSIVRVYHGEEDASFLVLHIPGKAMRYNIVSKTFEKVHEFKNEYVDKPGDLVRFRQINGCQYIESLHVPFSASYDILGSIEK